MAVSLTSLVKVRHVGQGQTRAASSTDRLKHHVWYHLQHRQQQVKSLAPPRQSHSGMQIAFVVLLVGWGGCGGLQVGQAVSGIKRTERPVSEPHQLVVQLAHSATVAQHVPAPASPHASGQSPHSTSSLIRQCASCRCLLQCSQRYMTVHLV